MFKLKKLLNKEIILIFTVFSFILVSCKKPTTVEEEKHAVNPSTFSTSDLGAESGNINDYFSPEHIQDVDILCSVEPPISPGHYCCGFLYYKNCKDVLDFVKYFIGRVTDRYREADYSDDQLIFNELVSQKDPNLLIKIGDLPEEKFCNGHYLKTRGRWTKDGKIKYGVVTNNMYMAHANWMVGDKAKVNFLRKLGLYQSKNWWSWLVDSPLSPRYWQQWRWNRSN